MRTTLNLPDELMRAVKILAAQQNRTLQEMITELLRRGLAAPRPQGEHRVVLPLVDCAKTGELSPETLSEILLEQEEG
jgi:plasmid stability protein